jgi:hypothetical protein
MAAKSSAERQAARDDRQRSQGRVQRKVWATPAEHEKIKQLLQKLRDDL